MEANQRAQQYSAREPERAAKDFSESGFKSLLLGMDLSELAVDFRILNDDLFEGLETFTVALSNPTGGATIGSRSTTTVTIIDDESVTPGTLDAQFDPGGGANGTVLAIQWQAGDSMVIGGSFTAFDGVARPARCQFTQVALR